MTWTYTIIKKLKECELELFRLYPLLHIVILCRMFEFQNELFSIQLTK